MSSPFTLPRLSSLGFLIKPLVLVLAPTLLCAAYWTFFYTPVYETVVVAVPRSGERPGTNDQAGAMLGSALRSKDVDSRMLEHYLSSPGMLALLDADLDLRTHFSNRRINAFQRLSTAANTDTLLAHYRKHIRIIVDSSALLHIEVKAYDAGFSVKLADRILAHAEIFLNTVSKTLAAKQVEFIRLEVAKAEKQLQAATERLASYQNKAGQLDPSRTSSDLMGVISRLESELARGQATLTGRLTLLSADAPQLVADRVRIESLAAEIANIRTRLAAESSTGGRAGLADDILRFNHVLIESEFAAKTYASALLALQAAHSEASYNVRTLIVLSKPQALESAAYPRIAYWTLTAFALFGLVFTFCKLVYDSIAAHIDR